MHPLDLPTFLIRLGAALFLGITMGLERQWRHRMAGTRTNGLVAAAAAAFTMIGLMDTGMGNASRIVGQIVTGVGFLGAGVIFKEGGSVHGLNTAATVWCAAAVGALSGAGFPQFSVAVALAAILTNVLLRPLAYRLEPGVPAQETNYLLQLTCSAKEETQVRALLLSAVERNNDVALTAINSEDLETGNRVRVSASLRAPNRNDQCLEQVVARLSLEASVSSASWHVEKPVVD
jgi:putative Mg2+ transporter-C (MgtC) family protein